MKTALITGASRGIGEATAYQLAKEYDCVAIMSRNTDGKLNAVANQIHTTTNCECIPFTGDVSDFAFVEDCVRSLATSGHPVDTLVNNAGISLVGLFQDMTPEEFDCILRINVTSVYNTCHAVIPDMVRNQRGRILNISSVWGLVGASCEVAYSACKGGVNAFTRALAKELAPSNIQVNAIACGVIDTDMVRVLGEETLRELAEQTPLGRLGRPEDIAAAVSYLASDKASFITGQVLAVDGAFVL